jgi:hypothetical protein
LIEVDSACGDAHASGLLAMVLKSGKPVAVRNPREVATQDVNRERSGHKKRTDPEAPVTQ